MTAGKSVLLASEIQDSTLQATDIVDCGVVDRERAAGALGIA